MNSEEYRANRDTPKQHPLSFAQERLWFLEQLEPGTPLYNSSIAFRTTGPLNVEALRQAVQSVVDRHEVVRSTYAAPQGIPHQIVQPTPRNICKLIELDVSQQESREQLTHRMLYEECSRPFDLTNDIMLRAFIYRFDPTDHVLLFVMHHIATDGWSLNLLTQEIAACYNAYLREEDPILDLLPIQYADYAARQRNDLEGEVASRDLAYWRTQLEGVPSQLELPAARLRSAVPDYHGERIRLNMPPEVAQQLQRVAREHHATPFMVLLSVFFMLLHRYSAQDDLTVGIPIAGRLDPDVESLIGFFVNMLVIREHVSSDRTFAELLTAVRGTCLDAYEHQQLPFERLVALLQPERIRNRTPFFQVSLIFQPDAGSAPSFSGLSLERLEIPSESAKFDLTLSIRKTGDTYSLSSMYRTELFDRDTVRSFLEQFLHACTWVIGNPQGHLADVEFADPETIRRAREGLGQPEPLPAYPTSIVAAYRQTAREHATRVALTRDSDHMTYRELDERSDRVAALLMQPGAPSGEPIGVYLAPCFDAVVAYLAILKSGACYVPLDTDAPEQRTLQLLGEAGVKRVITTQNLATAVLSGDFEVFNIDTLDDSGDILSQTLPIPDSADAAYVIFTSGSTGQPKGVRVPHRAVLRLVIDPDYVKLDTQTRIAHLASPSFDAATFEIWGPLLNGGTCVLPTHRLPSVSQLRSLIRKANLNTMWLTSTWFNAVVDEDVDALCPLHQLLIGGEALSVDHVTRALKALPETTLINGYGPTENTTFSCCYRIPTSLHPRARSVPIGHPIRGTTIFVLDDQKRPVAQGMPGELYLGGQGLALEYIGDKALTDSRFVASPFTPEPTKLYRTGDRVRTLPSGALEFLGRLDRQLKIRGFRVEPGEIEAVLSQHPSVHDAHVLLRTIGSAELEHLVAYIVPKEPGGLRQDELKQYAASRLPDYMIPAFVVEISTVPRKTSGKIDTEALPEVSRQRLSETAPLVPPRSDTEARIANIWRQLLQVDELGIHSNFFQLGGHSLLAVRLVAQIESTFRVSVPLAVLFDAPTIEALAKRVEASGSLPSRSTIIPLNAADDNRPFFCVPPAGSSVYHFSNLVQLMSSDIPFYGIQPLGLEPGEKPQRTVEAMAARYLEDLQAIQPHGPYKLGGRCFGAFVAFEMAQQLAATGQEVSLLVLMDPSAPPGVSRDAKYYANRVGYFRRRGQLIPAIRRYLRARLIEFRQLWVRGLLANAHARRLAREQRVHRKAQDAYRPNPYPRDIDFLGAKEDYHPEDTRALWRHMTTSAFRLHLIPGNHRTITQEPNLRTFANTLEKLIHRADEPQEQAAETDLS